MSKFTEYIGSQFGNPRGRIGKIYCTALWVVYTTTKQFFFYFAAIIASASASRLGISVSFIVEVIVTIGSTIVIFFIVSRAARMVFPAEGAQEPF